jgi:GH25 family lysozyme M1 (1,4-beta-N-acetylmuramidase)/ABC-type amino acid transport substrate-binding protein
MANRSIYTVGGTVQAGGGIYIKRKADDDLLQLCRQADLAFILSSRQVGKSSLMTRTAEQLGEENIRSSIIDLSSLGTQLTQEEWYLGILNIIANDLSLETNIFDWWKEFKGLGPAQRFFNFLRDVMLKEVQESIVLFFDEIDTTLSLAFADDFFTTLRAIYNARSNTLEYKRLSFVLVGVATPGDLISDSKRTPFNIGRRVEINDFTLAEALPLAQGLGEQAVQVLTWIFQYTSGHPYLTQRLCAYLASSTGPISEQDVQRAVEHLFTGEQGKQDNNLQFVRDMLSKRSPDVTKVLLIYGDVRSDKRVMDDERSIAKAHLKLSGLVRSEQGVLRVRNEIYNTVFNSHWVKENTPKNWQKVALISISAALGVLVLVTLGVLIYDVLVAARVNGNIRSFFSTPDATHRLSNLADIYRARGILQNTDSRLQAAQLFYSLPRNDQEEMFNIGRIANDPRKQAEFVNVQNDLVTVIVNLYGTVADVDPNEDNTRLLKIMSDSLDVVINYGTVTSLQETAASLQIEINAWLGGREKARNGNADGALTDYDNAINENISRNQKMSNRSSNSNQATFFERAKVYVALERYTDALNDLDAALSVARESVPEQAVADTPTPSPTASLLTPSTTPSVTQAITSAAGPTQTEIPGRQTPISTIPATSQVALTPEAGCTCQVPVEIGKGYESNFTTPIEVINAIRTLIDATVGLQLAIQASQNDNYNNLQNYGLIDIRPSTGLLADIFKRGYIMVATDPNYEPQSFLNTEGKRPDNTKCPTDALTTAEMQGFDVDVAKAVGDTMGVETCFATPDWDMVTAGTWNDKWDISIGSMIIKPTRQKVLDFSVPYYYTPAIVAVRDDSGITDFAGLDGKALCVGAATPYEAWLKSDKGALDLPENSIYASPPNVTVVSLDTDQECAQAIALGSNDFIGYITSESVVDANIAAGFPVVKLASPVFSEDIAAAFDKSSTLSTESLRAQINKIFNVMRQDGRLSALSNQWFRSDLTQAPEIGDFTAISSSPSQSITSTPLPSKSRFTNGIDVSLFEPVIDWAKVKGQNIDFVFIRASQGERVDPTFDTHWTGAKEVGIIRGAYHFLDRSVDCSSQAKTFLEKVNLESSDLPPVLVLASLPSDISTSKGTNPSGTVPAATLTTNEQLISCAETWLTIVEDATGRRPIIYSSQFFLIDQVSDSNGNPPAWSMKYPLWIASYPNNPPGENDLPLQPEGWASWAFWQYSERATIVGIYSDQDRTKLTNVDLNYFHGNLSDLQQFIANSSNLTK